MSRGGSGDGPEHHRPTDPPKVEKILERSGLWSDPEARDRRRRRPDAAELRRWLTREPVWIDGPPGWAHEAITDVEYLSHEYIQVPEP